MKIQTNLNQNVLTIYLIGELDETACAQARYRLDDCIDHAVPKAVIINLSQLNFMDSSGIGLLIGRFKRLQARGVPMMIDSPSGTVDKIFRVSGLYRLMPKIS